jgi:hypothetical protein
MLESGALPRPALDSNQSRVCPWCAGELGFAAAYPLAALVPFALAESIQAAQVPVEFRSVPAWVCRTPHCRYRERG